MTIMTESPRKKSLGIYRSLFWGRARLPLPFLGISVHISRTLSKTIFMCLSKALTFPRSFLLLRQLISTWQLVLTAFVSRARGPSWKISSYGVCWCYTFSCFASTILCLLCDLNYGWLTDFLSKFLN